MTAVSAATAMTRSRVRSASRLGDHTLRRLRHRGESAMASLGLELDRPRALDIRARHLPHAMLETVGHVDLDAMGRAGHRILDWLDVGNQHARDLEPRLATILVEGPVDRREYRVVHFR